ncbi:NAD(P)/FAD-dependent oxidoreductase [Patulibacter minatonensis]|uniref:NAD(P)/FAD-dependent oxidoreductase n=1 Tax=Patulibacter minatonensis TaxID=298163 RepID=UPI00047AAD01|nr:FAD-dependent oxidoreductase [Patulibacter minatonensis]
MAGPLNENSRVVIVGAGHGGVAVAGRLRQAGYDGKIVLLGDEPGAPYHRPPLSKTLLGESHAQPLKPTSFYTDQRIDLRSGVSVVGIDRRHRNVQTAHHGTIGYDTLVLATGSRSRPLKVPGSDLDGVVELRTATDAERLRGLLRPGTRLVVVGGGYVGLEVAAAVAPHGINATIIEREDRLLARVASRELSAHLEAAHRNSGIGVRCGAEVAAFVPRPDGALAGVQLRDGRRVEADVALVGIGALADDALARDAGLACDDGVLVDEDSRTDDPSIWAVGDATRRLVRGADAAVRLESIPSATEQASIAVAAMLGHDRPATEVPWFWSDQLGHKLQMAGFVHMGEETVVRGDRATDRFALFHLKDGRIVAVEAVNSARDYMAGRKLIRDAVPVDRRRLADTETPLRAVALVA